MKMRIPFTIPVALACILLAHGAWSPSGRIGLTEIYPNPAITPGAASGIRDTVHQARVELINPNTGKVDTTRCVAHSDNMACYEEDHLISLEDGGDPKDPRNLWPEPYNTRVGGTIMGAHQKDVVEGFIHDEICFDIPHSKKTSYIPASTSLTLRRGQEILAGDWFSCYEAIRSGKPCR